jgi:hypothetical protein
MLTLTATAAEAQSACARGSRLVGRCFLVHGRLSAYNGTPTFRIWPIGGRRLLGVDDVSDTSGLPAAVKRLLPADAFTVTITGDYRLCPFTRSRPGWMQYVCIAGASHLETRPRP